MGAGKRLFIVLWTVIVVGMQGSLFAGTLNREELPPVLKPWQSWVLHGYEHRFCPSPYNRADEHRCAWPSRLKLALTDRGGRFSQEWVLFKEGWVPLPGDVTCWPMGVTADGEETVAIGRQKVPHVFLKPGRHDVAGLFHWEDMPEMIRVPAETGLVGLMINGQKEDFPLRDARGRLWLKKREVRGTQEDRLDVKIYRLLKDTIPMRIISRMEIHVSGRSREEGLKGILLKGAIPMRMKSPLPARFGERDRFLIQVRPGRWSVEIESRLEGPVHRIGPVTGEHGREIWSFDSRNHLRMVKVVGVPSVDPSQTNVPDAWKKYPAYIVKPGSEIEFDEIRRGDPDPAPDQLHLKRTWWLDFDGRGYTMHDRITGTMSRRWSLAMRPPVTLGHVTVNGLDQLITEQNKQTKRKAGIELRQGRLDMAADSRLEEARSHIPAVGWDHDFQSVNAMLQLPPGWRLLTATGVDVIPGTWFDQWTLLDLFLILIIGMAVWRMFGIQWGIMALFTVGLTYHEPGAPKLVWLHLLAGSALLRMLSGGWIRRAAHLWFWGALIALLVLAVPFMVQQIRVGIYPQLDRPGAAPGFAGPTFKGRSAVAPQEEAVPKKKPAVRPRKGQIKTLGRYKALDSVVQSGEDVRQQAVLTQDPNALIQTGPGLPSWSWRSVSMKWNGPVDRDQQIRLWLVSPPLNLMLSLLRVILLALFIVRLIPLGSRATSGAAPAAVVLLLFPLFAIQQAEAITPGQNGVPDERLLEQLRERLLEPDGCFPYCADSPGMHLEIRDNRLVMHLEIHAHLDTAVPLPGNGRTWSPDQVLLDNKPAQGLRRDGEMVLWVHLPAGRHRLTLVGRANRNKALQIPFALVPRRATVLSDGWDVQGVGPEGRVEGSLQLIPKKKAGASTSPRETSLMPFLQIERVISLGLTWQVTTTLRRITPVGTPVVLTVPLLDGESVHTAGIRVEKGKALIHLSPGSRTGGWVSSLEQGPVIKLTAPTAVPWTETWILDASPIWHCETSGIPVIHHQDREGFWKPQWQPWPGETVTIGVSRPKAIPGRSVTLDSVLLGWVPGARFHKGSLTLRIRASRGGQHKVKLPEGARLQVVKLKGKSQPIRKTGEDVVIPIQPGLQTAQIEWHQNRDGGFLMSGPRIHVGQEAVNANIRFQMPRNRWILWTGGPRLGPAVLFWSYVIVVILAALALGRISWTPLGTGSWILLGLGLTQVHPLTAIMVVGWLLALGWRGKQPPGPGRLYFNTIQILLVLWTGAALVGMYLAIQQGLLGIPDMQIQGNGSYALRLQWMQDRIPGDMPRPWVFSVPLFWFRILMLLWALWLAYALLKWLQWGWRCFHEGGGWRKIRRDRKGRKNKEPAERDKGAKGEPSG